MNGELWREKAKQQKKPCGFVNDGNTCYFSAILQVLLQTPQFTSLLESPGLAKVMRRAEQKSGANDSEQPVTRSRRGRSTTQLFDALKQCLDEYKLKSSMQSSQVMSPSGVRRAIAAINPRWVSFRQQDAHELLLDLLDRLQGEVMSAQVRLMDSDPADKLPRSKSLCPAVGAFSGCLEHHIACLACGLVTKNKEFMNHLSLQLPIKSDAVKLQDLMDAYFEDEEVQKSCEQCAATTTHRISHRIRRPPRVLIIHLKRFRYEATEGGDHRYTKLTITIDLQRGELDLSPFLAQHEGSRMKPAAALLDVEAAATEQQAASCSSPSCSKGSCSDGSQDENNAADGGRMQAWESHAPFSAGGGSPLVLMSLPALTQRPNLPAGARWRLGSATQPEETSGWQDGSLAAAAAAAAAATRGAGLLGAMICSPSSGIGGAVAAQSCSSSGSPVLLRSVPTAIAAPPPISKKLTDSRSSAPVQTELRKPLVFQVTATPAAPGPSANLPTPVQPSTTVSCHPSSALLAPVPASGPALKSRDFAGPLGVTLPPLKIFAKRPQVHALPMMSSKRLNLGLQAEGEQYGGMKCSSRGDFLSDPVSSSPDPPVRTRGTRSPGPTPPYLPGVRRDQIPSFPRDVWDFDDEPEATFSNCGAAGEEGVGQGATLQRIMDTWTAKLQSQPCRGARAERGDRRGGIALRDRNLNSSCFVEAPVPLSRVLLVEDSDLEPEGSMDGEAGSEGSGGNKENIRLAPSRNLGPSSSVSAEHKHQAGAGRDSQRRLDAPAAHLALPDGARRQSYSLLGVVCHCGSGPASGHYVANASVQSGAGRQWCRFNDECVEITTADKVLEDAAEDGYVLFFSSQTL